MGPFAYSASRLVSPGTGGRTTRSKHANPGCTQSEEPVGSGVIPPGPSSRRTVVENEKLPLLSATACGACFTPAQPTIGPVEVDDRAHSVTQSSWPGGKPDPCTVALAVHPRFELGVTDLIAECF